MGRIFVRQVRKEGVVDFYVVVVGCRGGSSSLLSASSELSDSSSLVVLACRACHEGRGPHSSGCSGSEVSGWVSRLIS